MSYTLHLNIENIDVEIKLQEQESPSTNSIQFGGRNYSIQYPEEQKNVIKNVIEKVLKQTNKSQNFLQFQEKIKEILDTSKEEQAKTISKIAHAELKPIKRIGAETLIEGELARKMDEYLESAHNLFSFSGTVLVKKEGKTILSKGYGIAHSANPNTSKTVFQIASVTKQFTAAAILKLVQEGKIKLEDPIKDHLPSELYSNKWDEIQIHHLLCHRSGLANNHECKAFSDAKNIALSKGEKFEPSKVELIQYFKNMDLIAMIDQKTHYSNFGYYLLGAIIEHHNDNKSYGDFIKNLLPNEMTSTGYYNDSNYSNLPFSLGFHLNNKQDDLAPHVGAVASEAYAAGGLYSNVDDLAIWNQALLSGKIIDIKLVKEMTKVYGTDEDQSQNFGYGLEIDEIAGKKAIFHGGTLDGYKAQSCTFINEDIGKSDMIIILANNYDIPEIAIRNTLASILNNQNFISFSNKSFDANFPNGKTFHIEGRDFSEHRFIKEINKNFIIQPNKERCLLIPLTNGRYLNMKYGIEWEFISEEARAYGRSGQELGLLKKI